MKGKGGKERYIQLSVEFQRIARKDKRAFLSEQYNEIEKNSRMGKTRHIFKKAGDTKGIFHAKIGTTKDKNSKDWTEAEDIKRRWQEYTEELYKKDLNDPDNNDGVVTYLEPDILVSEVKCAKALLWTKIVEVMELQLSNFKSQKMMMLSAALNMPVN